MSDLEDLLKVLVSPHLTDKSIGRVEQVFVNIMLTLAILYVVHVQVFGVVKNPDLLDSCYIPKKNDELHDIMGRVVEDMNACIEAGVL